MEPSWGARRRAPKGWHAAAKVCVRGADGVAVARRLSLLGGQVVRCWRVALCSAGALTVRTGSLPAACRADPKSGAPSHLRPVRWITALAPDAQRLRGDSHQRAERRVARGDSARRAEPRAQALCLHERAQLVAPGARCCSRPMRFSHAHPRGQVMRDCSSQPNASASDAVSLQGLGLTSERNSLEHVSSALINTCAHAPLLTLLRPARCPVTDQSDHGLPRRPDVLLPYRANAGRGTFAQAPRRAPPQRPRRHPAQRCVAHSPPPVASCCLTARAAGEFALLLEGDFTGAADLLPLSKLEKLLEVVTSHLGPRVHC
jgi:hypothetical protein